MSRFRHPPLLSPETVLAAVAATSRRFGASAWFLKNVAGRRMSPDRHADLFRGFSPDERDVFVATFPKSGTNWAMQIAQQIAWRGDARFDHIYDVVAWPESPFPVRVPLGDRSGAEAAPTRRRVIKTSSPAQFVPYDERSAYVTVIRDPKEVAVSAYHFITGTFGLTDLTVADWVDSFTGPAFPAGSWAAHAASYWAWRDRPNVAVLCFADMLRDLDAAVRAVAEVMGVALQPSEHDQVVARSRFAWMREHEDLFGPPLLRFRPPEVEARMIRKGETGRSGELLSRDQQAAIDRHFQAELRTLGSDLPYADLFDVVA